MRSNCPEVAQVQVKNLSIDSQVSNSKITNQGLDKPLQLEGWQSIAKTVFDKVASFFILMALSPLLVVVAIAIKLESKGPIIFRQKRNGLNNQEFLIWKFRTMTVMENGSDVKQAEKHDARITRIGNILRKTSIDELPQFINVLLGDMSIVGPRPHPVALNEKYCLLVYHYDHRTAVKPGLTGLAQIKGYRGPTHTAAEMQERIDCDIDYIKNWSLWLDCKIVALTPYYGLMSKNAF